MICAKDADQSEGSFAASIAVRSDVSRAKRAFSVGAGHAPSRYPVLPQFYALKGPHLWLAVAV